MDREECVDFATSDGELQRPRSFFGIDKRYGPIKTVTRRIELPFAGVRRHYRIRTRADKYYKVLEKVAKSRDHYSRKRDGNNQVIKGNILVFQFVFDVDIASAIIGRSWPAINFPKRGQSSSRQAMWQYAGVLTGERDITFVLTRVPPLQHCKWLADGKFTRWVLECNASFIVRGKLPDVRVLLKLKLRSKCGGR
jgi:hypothetical protein